MVRNNRPFLDDDVTDGSVYFGQEAKARGLIDAVKTMDEYILERIEAGDRVLKLHRSQQGRNKRRLTMLDLYPHLKTWATNALAKRDVMAIVLQTGTWLGFARHLIQTYGPRSD